MKIVLNGKSHETASTDLVSLLAEIDFADAIVATALNGEFVSVDQRDGVSLQPGDRVEIVAPMQGG
ncbi:sulfur carrier protein ThiS [Pseudaminobacter salicylatoxidans]|uniref:sulfur carrier protein ThiS n=1 Tax=Pseudaminobacter salicylatoxidans TaxID=93369 RepID=UPI00031D4B17|nr:sulfur carrier protein ThiS [Pseudaminobacter salicylatoxidans]